jgi:hypothetical protein
LKIVSKCRLASNDARLLAIAFLRLIDTEKYLEGQDDIFVVPKERGAAKPTLYEICPDLRHLTKEVLSQAHENSKSLPCFFLSSSSDLNKKVKSSVVVYYFFETETRRIRRSG